LSLYLVLDQGTSSTKAFLFNAVGDVLYSNRIKHLLHRPKLHHVESDPIDIATACVTLISEAIKFSKSISETIKCMGLAVQRSTFLFWDKQNLKPLTPAISWQDNRAKNIENELQSLKNTIFEKTGQPLSGHFGGPKFLHLIRNNPFLASAIENKSAWFGPLSSFLTHSLTGKCFVDGSIACRSIMMGLESLEWDDDLCSLFGATSDVLPEVKPTLHDFGLVEINDDAIPLYCVIGDQQAALIGQGGWAEESVAINLGTSGSLQINSGENPTRINGLLSSVLWSSQSERYYILEGTINACNSLFYWLETDLGIPHREMVWEERCSKTESSGVFFPGFWGIAAPYWVSGKSNSLHGFPANPEKNEIIRAGMESIGFLIHDIFSTVNHVQSLSPDFITVSGGGARTPLLQFISDILQIPIGVSSMKDKTAMGVFNLLKISEDVNWKPSPTSCSTILNPKMNKVDRMKKLESWRKVLISEGIQPTISQ
jgi:glycerol kinase